MPTRIAAGRPWARVYIGPTEIGHLILNGNHIFDKVDNRPTIANWGATAGAGKMNPLTLNRSSIPIDITVSATVTGATSWTIYRNVGGASQQVAASPDASTQPFYQESLAADFHPSSTGWHYVLSVTNANGTRSTACEVRVVTASTLSGFAATSPTGIQTPSGIFQRSYLSWVATAGDPTSTWSLTQTGTRTIAHLPSSSRLLPANGGATGNSRQFVQVAGTSGGYTDLTLTGVNDGGTSAQTVRINWPS